jgi:hypothetical protein
MTTVAFSKNGAVLSFSRRQWKEMIRELGRRGRGRRESGCFLLADNASRSPRVRLCVYLDDLDPYCLQGGINFDGRAYSQLWDICADNNCRVIADAHTHPSSWVSQSPTDASNPMVATWGHLAIIVPNYAKGKIRRAQVGLHQYRGNDGWISWNGRDVDGRIQVSWW